MAQKTLIIGTRGSRLALAQANRVKGLLPGPSRIEIIRTSGDRFKTQPLHEQEGVGFFTKEIEEALLEGRIDLAVHSLKDLPTALAPGLMLSAVLERDDPGDLLLLKSESLDEGCALPLKKGAAVGGSSLRRAALLLAFRPDLKPTQLRGNVPTRIEKTLRGDCEAIVIARAGVTRLSLDVSPLLAYDLNPNLWICAPGQGAIAVESRADEREVLERLAPLDHTRTRACVQAERRLLLSYGGGCHAPFGAWTEAAGESWRIHIGAPDREGTFKIGRFQGADLGAAREEAEAWIKAGRPAHTGTEKGREGTPERISQEEQEWICRPARPWC